MNPSSIDSLTPEQIIQGASFAYELWKNLSPTLVKIVESKSDRYLNYDPAFLLKYYAAETPLGTGLTYTELLDLTKVCSLAQEWWDSAITIDVIKTPFRRSLGTSKWQEVCSAAFAARKAEGRTRQNEDTIRLCDFRSLPTNKDGGVSLKVQRASYYDQAHSNLILDFDRANPSRFNSLRDQLHAKYGDRLPPLRDKHLANTIGLAALLFYWDSKSKKWIPYVVKRVTKIGVFPGGLHCTASGVAKWPDRATRLSFQDLSNHMYDEIEEEVGLHRDDILELRPMGLCREMARGGKPQIFFAGLTLLGRKELADRRRQASNIIDATTRIPEIERDRFFQSADVVMTPSSLRTKTGKWGITLEAAGTLHYGVKYLKGRLSYLAGFPK